MYDRAPSSLPVDKRAKISMCEWLIMMYIQR